MADRVLCLVALPTGERKKVHLETGSYDELLCSLSALTAITDDTLIQIYDEEVDGYIDLEEQVNRKKAKLKVARKVAPATDCASTDSAADNICDKQSRSPSDSQSLPVVSFHNVPLQKSHDYLDYVLPSFEPFEAVLQRGTPPSPKLRRFIVTKPFPQCFAIAWYPSRQLYHVAAERLVLKNPHLIDRIDYGSGLDSWIQALQNKFKNTRKKVETCSEEMELLKRKRHHTSQKEATEAPPRNKKLCRLPNYTHLIVYGETPESLQSHKTWLMDTALSATWDDNALKLRLRATAKERHDKLKGMEIREALATFPFLSFEATLLMEFDIVFKKSIKDCMQAGFNQLCDVILRRGEEHEVPAFTQAAPEDTIPTLLQLLANRCCEPLNVILTEDQVPLTPCLRTTEGRDSLFVDQVLITEASSFLGGVCCLFAAFWVFHIEYPNKAHLLLTFLEHAFLGVVQTRPRIKAIELINVLKPTCSECRICTEKAQTKS